LAGPEPAGAFVDGAIQDKMLMEFELKGKLLVPKKAPSPVCLFVDETYFFDHSAFLQPPFLCLKIYTASNWSRIAGAYSPSWAKMPRNSKDPASAQEMQPSMRIFFTAS
jgi:hypothetical protein